MSHIHQVTLEILRHGPAHNQLLSPLTRYLALCGNHSPETLAFPWEHLELMAHLRILRYKDSGLTLEIERRTLGRRLAAVLGDVKSLISELSPQHSNPCGRSEVTELRLVLSSEELALIPFELALTPEGCPGSGEALVLQNRAPVTITRQVRRVNNRCFDWPKETRILFAAASPQGQIPVRAHLLALRKALAPWIPKCDNETTSRERFGEKVEFLPNATWGSLVKACRENQFSHIHILAHGQATDSGDGVERYGLALHKEGGAPNEIDLVDGKRLADALRCFRSGSDARQSCPAVVTLATCDGGNPGALAGVLGSSSSIAHTLHESGVPLVIASQFPLTFRGSAIFAETVYEDLLRGKDPRLLMADLRRRLHGDVPGHHDWASLVCYCALPPNLENQLADHRINEANRSAKVALNWADILLDQNNGASDQNSDGSKACTEELKEAQAMAVRAIKWLESLCQDRLIQPSASKNDLGGLLASAEKRLAEVHHKVDRFASQETIAALSRSRKHYRNLYEEDATESWAIVQFLVLEVVLRRYSKDLASPGLTPDDLRHLWNAARWMSELELSIWEGKPRAWALASLIELELLAILLQGELPVRDSLAKERDCKALDHARTLARAARDCHMEVYSTRRQIRRYCNFFNSLDPNILQAWQAGGDGPTVGDFVDRLLDILPDLPAALE